MKKLLCLLLALIMLLTLVSCDSLAPRIIEQLLLGTRLKVHFINVGQGDCTLLESRDEFVLIDAGETEQAETVLNYLKKHCADSLKYVIATHPHSDHVGGMAKVIERVPTENFITVETDQNTGVWKKVLKAVDKNDVNYIDARVGDTYRFGDASFTILAPLSDNYDGYNNYSVVTRVDCGDIRFLLTGDAEAESEKEMLNAKEDLRADVLKCGHHGSSTSSTAAFLKAVDPAFAIISCGKYNDYGHPHEETLEKLKMLDCFYLRTDTRGTIVAETDGKYLRFTIERGKIEIPTYTARDHDTSDTPLYIGNRRSLYFHYFSCSGVGRMSENNKVGFNTREEAVKEGYKPCPHCKP